MHGLQGRGMGAGGGALSHHMSAGQGLAASGMNVRKQKAVLDSFKVVWGGGGEGGLSGG